MFSNKASEFLAIIDLESTWAEFRPPRWMGQVLSYCQQLNAPLGMLFDGTEARVFLNTSMKGLSKHKNLFDAQPIASVGSHEKRRLVELFMKFSKSNLALNPIAVANDLASKRRLELRNRERHKLIQSQLLSMLSVPTPQVFAALAAVENAWTSIVPKPSVLELSKAWAASHTVKPVAQLRPKTSGRVTSDDGGTV